MELPPISVATDDATTYRDDDDGGGGGDEDVIGSALPSAPPMDPAPSPLDSANAVLIPDDENELYRLDAQAAATKAPEAVSVCDERSESLHRSQTSSGDEFFIPRDDGNEPGEIMLAIQRAEQLLARTQMAEHDPEGKVPDFWCPSEKFAALGTGITLYFRQLSGLVHVFALVAFLAGVICCAHIAVALMPSSQGLDEQSMDLLGLSRLAIPTLATELMAQPPPATVLESVFNGGVDIRTVNLFFSSADALITAMILAYVLFILWTFKRAAHRADMDVCSLTDYAICVHGLPPDATAREVKKYFEETLNGCEIAEVTVLKPCRDVLRLNRQREIHEKRLRRKQKQSSSSSSPNPRSPSSGSPSSSPTATASPPAADTPPTSHAPTPTRVVKQVMKVSNVVEAMRAQAFKSSKTATKAFVVFENEIELHGALRSLPRSQIFRVFQRRQQRFRGRHPISVEPAADPSNVIWENLEFTMKARAFRKLVVLSLLLAMILCSAAFIFYARSQEPPSSLDCAASDELGFLKCGDVFQIDVLTDRANTTIAQRALLQSYWAGSGGKEMLDSCLEDDRYIGFQGGRNVWRPGPGAMPDANITSLAPYVPIYNFAPFSNADNCSAVACYSCYCERVGFRDYYSNKDGHKGFCGDYWEAIGMKTIIRLGIVIVVLGINFSLNVVIRRLAVFERAHTLSNQEATMTIKLAIAQFVNMALVTLAVYAYVEEFKGFYDDLGLRTFEWATDFSYRWYQQVGASIVLTLCASAITKPMQGYISHYWNFMWRQSKVTRRKVPVSSSSSSSLPSSSSSGTTRFVKRTVLRKKYEGKLTQNECDRIFIGPRFLLSERFGEILSMWLACLLFSSGMPFLFIVFFGYIALQVLMDRVLLLRVCRRPAQYDDKLALQFLKYLPIGLLLKTAFGFWMFSGDLASYTIGNAITGVVNVTDVGSSASDDFRDRVLKLNGFIQLLAFLCVLLVLIVRFYWSFIVSCVKTCSSGSHGRQGGPEIDRRVLEGNPPFSVARSSGALEGVHDTYNPVRCCYDHRVLNVHHPEIGAMLFDTVLAAKNAVINVQTDEASPAASPAARRSRASKAMGSRRKSTLSTSVPVDGRW